MTKVALGLDVAKDTIEVCLLRQAQKRGDKYSIPNSIAGGQQLIAWLADIPQETVHVCLEPTGKYSRVIAGYLHREGFSVSQVNSYAVMHHGRGKNLRSKTDRIDAYLLADYCLKENPPVWEPPTDCQAELTEIQARIDDINETLVQEKNRIKAQGSSATVDRDIEEHIAYLTVRKERLVATAEKLIQTDPLLDANYKILNSILGIGTGTALALLAAVRYESFKDARSVGSFAGLTPRGHQSGTSIHKHESISRRGSGDLRKRLYFPAMVAKQHNPQMRAFAERLAARGKPPKVVICAVMRKLLVLSATLIRKQQLYDPNFGMTEP
jgi:transposase